MLLLLALVAPAAMAQEAAAGSPDPSRVVGAPKGSKLSGPALEEKTKEVAALLRCPVCQGLSIYDSPASMAVKMKQEVKTMLAAGYSGEQILEYFEKSYGEFVRLQPPARGVNWLLWLAPLGGLTVGFFIVRSWLKKKKDDEPVAAAPSFDALPEDPELAGYVLRVRELAYGWPGGKRPAVAAERSAVQNEPLPEPAGGRS